MVTGHARGVNTMSNSGKYGRGHSVRQEYIQPEVRYLTNNVKGDVSPGAARSPNARPHRAPHLSPLLLQR